MQIKRPLMAQIENYNKIRFTPEVMLWRAVISQALYDASWKPVNNVSDGYYFKKQAKYEITNGYWRDKSALQWIFSNATHFQSIVNLCEFTGYNLDEIRRFAGLSLDEYLNNREAYDVKDSIYGMARNPKSIRQQTPIYLQRVKKAS